MVAPVSDQQPFRSRLPTAPSPGSGPPLGPGSGTATGLTVEILPADTTPAADELVRFRIRWSDGDGRYAGSAEDWGDGTVASSVRLVSCQGSAGPHRGDLITAHRFSAGRYRVRLAVTTADCAGRRETRTAEVTIVSSAGPSPEEPDDVPTGVESTDLPILPADPEQPFPSAPGATPPAAVTASGTPAVTVEPLDRP